MAATPIIQIQKITDNTTIVLGGSVLYTLVLTNTGTANTNNFHIIDIMPTGAILNIVSIQVYGESGTIVDYSTVNMLSTEVGPLAIGQTIIVKFQVNTNKNIISPMNNSCIGYYSYNPAVGEVLYDNKISNVTLINILDLGIRGIVWYDANCNGLIDTGELLAQGIVVELYSNSDLITPIAFTTTDINGYYEFNNLTEGAYYVKVILPNGYSYTLSNVGTNNNINSNIDQSSGFSEEINLNILDRFATINSGLCHPNTISGKAFYDCNNNGIIDDSDPLLCGVKISLINNQGIEILTTTTDCDGYYEFTKIPAGTYTVKVVNPVDMNYVTPVTTDYYGSKPDIINGEFQVTLTNKDYIQGFTGFIGDFKLKFKYCYSNNMCSICSYKKNNIEEPCPTNDNSCIGCNSCRSNKNITTSRISCKKCNCKNSK